MTLPAVRAAEQADFDSVLNTITLAFTADPVNRWYLPDADRYLTFFPQVVQAFLGLSIESGACYMTTGGEGAAIWLPPGTVPDEAAMEAVIMEAPPAELQEPLGALFAAIETYHPHDEDCWYLPIIGVDPAHQGKGVGAALMKHATTRIDEAGALSYLESSNPANISLYERHGFEAMGQIPFGDSGIVTPMLRSRKVQPGSSAS